jgi:hypothetical protein
MSALDLTKPVQCKNGKLARIICTDRNDPEFTIVALVGHPWGSGEGVICFNLEGTSRHNDGDHQLVNIPQVTHEFVNYYPHLGQAYRFINVGEATMKRDKNSTCICIRVSKTDGVVTGVGLVP